LLRLERQFRLQRRRDLDPAQTGRVERERSFFGLGTAMAMIQPTPTSVIIPVRNEGGRIAKTIQSIVGGRSCCFPLELVIVDDASTDGACENLEQWIEGSPETRLTVRRLESWSGIPCARNRGAEIAAHPIYFITDGNTRFPRNWDVPIWSYFSKGRILAATIVDLASSFQGFGCQLMLPSMSVTWIPVPHAYGWHVPVSACTGTVIERELYGRLGGYDESLPLYGAAEPELSMRACLSGYEIVNPPGLRIHHRFRPRVEHDAFLASITPIQVRNYLRFACYYLPDDLLIHTCDYYARLAPEMFNRLWTDLHGSDVWLRRATFSHHLAHDFVWFARKFPLLRDQRLCNINARPTLL
jgi:glycosyltransferase involved in cell wall biosynthesis